MHLRCLPLLRALFALLLTASLARAAESYDVVIYGGTSGAITAAIQAQRMGQTAIIVSPDKHLGGLSAIPHPYP